MRKETRRVALMAVLFLGALMAPSQAQEQPFKGQTITVLVINNGEQGAISGPFYYWRDEWEKMTGAKLQIVEFPFGELHQKIFTDLIMSIGRYDVFIICAAEVGELVSGDFIVPIDDYYDDDRFPQWPKDAPPSIEMLHKWGDTWYGALNDVDGQVLYYRKDILSRPDYQARFKEKHGYDLTVPPKTMQQMYDIAEFFNGWDWNEDGEPDSGCSMHLKVGAQNMFQYMGLSAPFAVLPGEKVDNIHHTYWFDFETMKPLINEPGHVKALEFLIKLHKTGPAAQISWDLSEAWDYFLRGKSVMTPSFGDVASLAQEPRRSKIQGKIGATVLPGVMEVYDRGQRKMIQQEAPNVVGNTTGCSWHGVISKLSKNPEAAYHLLAFHATERVSKWNALLGWTGVDIGRQNQLLEPWGPQKIEEYINVGGWNRNDVVEFTRASIENFGAETTLPYLRIPGTPEYLHALDVHLSEALTGMVSAQEALDRVARDFEDITERLGREEQLRLYRESMNYEQ